MGRARLGQHHTQHTGINRDRETAAELRLVCENAVQR
jgi:hypothetical protein